MGRSVSYPSEALVVTFNTLEQVDCGRCDGTGRDLETVTGENKECPVCEGSGKVEQDADDFDELIEDFRQHLKHLFPSVEEADDWLGREDHVLAQNKLARFGMSEYCGLVAYWIVPNEPSDGYYRVGDSDPTLEPLRRHWIDSIKDKFVAAFGELTKVGAMSNGGGVYRRIDKD
jgi:hypothetical protein